MSKGPSKADVRPPDQSEDCKGAPEVGGATEKGMTLPGRKANKGQTFGIGDESKWKERDIFCF